MQKFTQALLNRFIVSRNSNYSINRAFLLFTVLIATFIFATVSFSQTTNCLTATVLTAVNASSCTPGTTFDISGTGTGLAMTTCSTNGTAANNWGQFVSNGTTATISYTPASGRDAMIYAYSGSCIIGLTEISCINANGSGVKEDLTLTSLTPGATYYVRIVRYGSTSSMNGSICIASSYSISTGAITGSPFCAGNTVSVPFTSYGTYSGNTYTAQLSDAAGSFSSPVSIGTLVSNLNSGTISATIPAGAGAGSGYRIRVISSSPSVTGSDNGTNLTIIAVSSLTLTSGAGTNAQTVCNGTAINNITYSVGGSATGAGVSGLPTGVTGAYSAGIFTVSGTPIVSGTFNYTITTTGGSCAAGTAAGTITVNGLGTISRTSAAGTDAQTVCNSSAINNITYSIGGTASGAGVSGLPSGVTGVYSAGAYTISGSPTANGTFNFTVTTTGGSCPVTATGTITVNALPTITRTSAAATIAQSVCNGASITNITYSIGGTATGAGVSGLPTGVTGNFSAGVFTISGAPTANGTFNYTVTTIGGSCGTATATGTITVNALGTVSLSSGAGTDAQTLCNNIAITNITYSVGGTATGAGVSGLPTGVTGAYSAGVFTISGTPTTNGTFNYTVTTTGGSCPVSAIGTITVNGLPTITRTSAAGTDAQPICNNSAITNITYSIAGTGTGGGVSGLPAGVSGAFSGGVYTISGTPTVNGTFNYTVTTTGGSCAAVSATGTITVNSLPTNIAPTATASICSGSSTNVQIASSEAGMNYQLRNNTGNVNIGSAIAGTGGTINLPTGIIISTTTFNVLATNATTGCNVQMTPTVTVTANTAPTVTPGNTINTCQDATPGAITLSGASIGGSASTGAWSITSGSGTLSSTAQTASPAAVTFTAPANYSGTVTLTLTTNAPATCSSVSGTRTINVNALPTVTISPNYCIGGGKVRLTCSAQSSYLWSTGATTQFIDVSIAGSYTVTGTNAAGCSANASITVAQELVTNGNFSAGNTGFITLYTYSNNNLYTESYYSVGANANTYHNNFFGTDHTTGSGNFMIVNGSPTTQDVWQQSVTVTPNTNYYFSAWAYSLNAVTPYAQLRFAVNDVQLGTTATLTAGPTSNAGIANWVQFYGSWNSGSSTTAKINIIDLQTALGGNDFGLDDISFSTLAPVSLGVVASGNTPVCTGTALYLTAAVTGGTSPYTYSWTGPSSYTSTSQNPVISSAAASNAGVYSVTVTDGYGCTANASTATISVVSGAATLTSASGSNIQTVCNNTAITNITYNVGSPATGAIVSGLPTGVSGAYSAGVFTISGTPSVKGIFNYTVTTTGGSCTASKTGTITVNAPTMAGLTSACIAATTQLTGSGTAASSNPWVSASTGVATVNSTGLVTGVSAGTSVITYTDNAGCITSNTITIKSLPSITGTLVICSIGSTTTLTGSGTANATNPWVSSNTSVATVNTTGVVTAVAAGTSIITYTNDNGCSITATVIVSVPTITGSLSICGTGTTTSLTGSGTPAASSPWVSATTSVATVNSSGVVTSVSLGTSIITYTNINGCAANATVTVSTIPTTPTISPAAATICNGTIQTLTVTNYSAGASPQTNSSGAISVAIPDNSATGATSTIAVSGIPSGAIVTNVSINYNITHSTDGDLILNIKAPNGNILNLVNQRGGSGNNFTNTIISSSSANPVSTGVAPFTGTYAADAASAVGATSNVSNVTVFSSLYSTSNGNWVFSARDNSGGQVGTITSWSVTITYTVPSITWQTNVNGLFTDAAATSAYVAQTTSTVYAKPSSTQTYTATATSSSGCTNTNTVTLTVNPTPTISGSLTTCVGFTTALTGSASAAASNPWVSATTSVATINASGVVSGVAAGTSVITYTNNNGCTVTATVTVTAAPTITGTLTACAGSTTTLTGTGTPAVSNPWVSATTSVATVNSSGVVTGVAAGTSVITYTNNNGCTVTATVTIVVSATDKTPTAAASAVCSGSSTNIQIASSQSGITYQLRNNTGNVNIGSTVAGTGGTINLPTGSLSTTTTFNILANNSVSGCAVQMVNTVTVTVNPTGQWIGGSSGDWNTAGNWCGGIPTSSSNVIIPAGATVNIQSANAVANSVNIATTGSLVMTGAYNLSISSGGTFTNSGTFTTTSSTGTVAFLGSGTISGTTTFKNIDTYGALNFGAASTIDGTFSIQTGGSVTGNSPSYTCPSSSLLYKPGSVHNRGLEWTTASSGVGYPANVLIQNNTTVNFPAAGNGFVCYDLQIESGSALRQDYSGGSASLRVGRNVTINGTLSLGGASGGDLYLGGSWLRNTGAVFNSNDRKVIFDGPSNFSGNGSSSVTITAPASSAKDNEGGFGGEKFAHIWIDKTNATDSVVLLSNITVNREIGFTKGTFSLRNSDVTIVSNDSRTADVAPVTNTANVTVRYGGSGRFVIQRFIDNPTSTRSWRLLASPLESTSAPTINAAYQGGVVNPDKTNPNASSNAYNPWPGYSTHITGPGGTYSATNGFDQGTNTASILYANSGVTSWLAPASTKSIKVTDQNGWMLFVRGDRGFAIGNQYINSQNTTLEPKGKINIGDVVKPIVAGRQVMGNPYASAISLLNVDVAGTLAKNRTYYMWDPKMFTSYTQPGKWVTFTGVGNSFVQTSSQSAYTSDGKIESGQAFVIDAASAGNIIFHESDKQALNSSLVGITSGISGQRPTASRVVNMLRTDIFVTNGSKYTLTDGVLNLFDTAYSNSVNEEDAKKFISFNTKESFSIYKDSVKLAIEKRNELGENDTIRFVVSKLNELTYQFRFIPTNLYLGYEAYLEDKYDNSRTAVSTTNASAVNFIVTADSLSKVADRFRLVFKSTFGVTFISLNAYRQDNKIPLQWKVDKELGIDRYELEKSTDGVGFAPISTLTGITNNNGSSSYQSIDEQPTSGMNYYRVKSIDKNGKVKYSAVAKVYFAKQSAPVTVYPNPIKGKEINFYFKQQQAGKYNINIYNKAGQLVMATSIQRTEGSNTATIKLDNDMAHGNYTLEILSPNKTRTNLNILY